MCLYRVYPVEEGAIGRVATPRRGVTFYFVLTVKIYWLNGIPIVCTSKKTVVIRISIVQLGEQDVAHFRTHVGIHNEAHGLANGLSVVDVMVTNETLSM